MRGLAVLVFVCCAMSGLIAQAGGEPLLSVANGSGPRVELTRQDLEALPQSQITTRTDFTDGRPTFSGPRVSEVLALVEPDGATRVRMIAANDYSVSIPVRDIMFYQPIFAMRQDGRKLSLRDKGPIWLMYPVDAHPELQTADFNANLIWQLVRVELQ